MKKKALAFALAALLLCGCGSKNEQQGKKNELPADRPYNRYIMETDKGYYINRLGGYGYLMAMQFSERDTGNQIFLCAKPECLHDGSENCTATYKKMACPHSVLYGDAIYSLLMEDGDNITLSLYKSALDGTSLTKVGDVFTVANSSEEEDVNQMTSLVIHKGYAYISYQVVLGGSPLFGFAGSSLVKMDISSGKTEELWSAEEYFSGYAQDIYGDGDYVYYTNYANNDNGGFFRYDINSGEIKKLWEKKYPVAGDNKFFFLEYDKENAQYDIYTCGKTDADIEKANSEGFELIIRDVENYYQTMRAYKDKLMTVDDGKVKIFSESGELLGEIAFLDEYPEGKYEYSDPFFQIDISDGKVYFFDYDMERESEKYKKFNDDGSYTLTTDYHEIVYSCPIDDIIAGTGEWKFEYGEKDVFTSGLMKHDWE